MVGSLAFVQMPDCKDGAIEERPLIVRHQVARQARLPRRDELDSRYADQRDSFRQHILDGQAEGLITLAEIRKRQIYGCAKSGLIRARAFAPAQAGICTGSGPRPFFRAGQQANSPGLRSRSDRVATSEPGLAARAGVAPSCLWPLRCLVSGARGRRPE